MAADIWAVADLLRGDYKRHEYGQVILPFTVLRRLDAVMAPTREAVWARDAALDIQNKQRPLELAAKLPFYNTSKQDFSTIAADSPQVAKNLRDYINGFSPNVREILARFDWRNRGSSTRWSGSSPRSVTWTSCPTTTWATSSST
jgi:type I restriction enzyme M protein